MSWWANVKNPCMTLRLHPSTPTQPIKCVQLFGFQNAGYVASGFQLMQQTVIYWNIKFASDCQHNSGDIPWSSILPWVPLWRNHHWSLAMHRRAACLTTSVIWIGTIFRTQLTTMFAVQLFYFIQNLDVGRELVHSRQFTKHNVKRKGDATLGE